MQVPAHTDFTIIQEFRHKNFKKCVLRQCRVRMNKTCVQKGKNSWIMVLLMLLSNYCSGTEVALWIIRLMWSHLVSSMGPALCERCGGAKLDGLGLVKDHRGQRLLPQRQHVQLGLQHGLEVLMETREEHTPSFRQTYNRTYDSLLTLLKAVRNATSTTSAFWGFCQLKVCKTEQEMMSLASFKTRFSSVCKCGELSWGSNG